MSSIALSTASTRFDTPGVLGGTDSVMAAMGFKGWTATYNQWGVGAACTSVTLYLAPVWLDAGVPISKIMFAFNPPGSGLTLCRWGIYGYSSKALLASSADISATCMTAAGVKEITLSATWLPPTSGLYWSGLLQVGTTPAQCPATLPIGGVSGITGGYQGAAAQAGLSDLPNPFVQATSNRIVHHALS